MKKSFRIIGLSALVVLLVAGMVKVFAGNANQDIDKAQIIEQFNEDVISGKIQPLEVGVPREITTRDGHTYSVTLTEAE
ncbi:MAG: hypothetical protein LBM18_01360 [Oscillospiraceae bacterium]|nr:hypothetical protein [Oscillospiraceae bacterium]